METSDCRLVDLADIENIILKMSKIRKGNLLPSMSQEELNQLHIEYNLAYRNSVGQLSEGQIRELKLYVQYYNSITNPKEPTKRQRF